MWDLAPGSGCSCRPTGAPSPAPHRLTPLPHPLLGFHALHPRNHVLLQACYAVAQAYGFQVLNASGAHEQVKADHTLSNGVAPTAVAVTSPGQHHCCSPHPPHHTQPARARCLQVAWVTATAGLAADQLSALLRDALGRRAAAHGAAQVQQGQQQDAAMVADWQAAICDVHAEYFEEYNRWARKLCLPVSWF